MIQVSIAEEDLSIAFTTSGKYNPDVVDDLKRRCLDTYREVYDYRVKTGIVKPFEKEETVE